MTSGDPAPSSRERPRRIRVPAIHDNRMISLADYRGSTPVLLGLFPGLSSPSVVDRSHKWRSRPKS